MAQCIHKEMLCYVMERTRALIQTDIALVLKQTEENSTSATCDLCDTENLFTSLNLSNLSVI